MSTFDAASAPWAFGYQPTLGNPEREAANLEIARRYLAAIEADTADSGTGEGAAEFFTSNVVQEEFPNRFVPNGAVRDLAALREAAARGREVLKGQRYATWRCFSSFAKAAFIDNETTIASSHSEHVYPVDSMRKFSVSTEIEAPAARVWRVMSDTERWAEWTVSVSSVKRLDAGPFTIGSRALIRQPKFPPALWKVTAIYPGRSFTWVSRGPGFRVYGSHSVEPTAGGSRATLSLDFQGVLGGAFGRMTKDINQRYLTFEATGLKARSENPAFHR